MEIEAFQSSKFSGMRKISSGIKFHFCQWKTYFTQFVNKFLIFEETEHFEICWRNTAASTETFAEKYSERNLTLHFTSYLSIALFKSLSHSKTIKNAKKLSIFGENDSRCLSNFLQTHIFGNFFEYFLNHISRTYNQINYRNIWFAKLIIILIMTAQVLFFDVFTEKDPYLNATEQTG